MKLTIKKLGLVLSSTMTAGFALVALTGVAHAASNQLEITPPSGNDRSVLSVTTDGPCTKGTNVMARLYGQGFPKDGQIVVGNSSTTAYQKTTDGGYLLPLSMTMRDFVNLQDEPSKLSGTYRIEVDCRDNVKTTSLQTFEGSITFTSAHDYTATPVSFKPTLVPKGDPLGDGAAEALASNAPDPLATANPNGSAQGTGSTPAPTATPATTTALSSSDKSSNSAVVLIVLIAVVAIGGAAAFRIKTRGSSSS